MDLHRVLADDPPDGARQTPATPAPQAIPPQPVPPPASQTSEQTYDRDQEAEAAAALLEMPKARKANPHLQHVYDSEDTASARDVGSPAGSESVQYTANATTVRRNANGSVSSVYSGNKIRHLKKEDGVPLWRRDIQYDFLKYVFEDDKRVFTKASDNGPGHTFADIYLDAMAKSSKCSKILKDKLLTERAAAINMAMVCLLVNVGRMNTTLNFFPEMRAQLRTYHSIPSLQAHQDPNAYKQLQDAPRLKSILKGATEDSEQPSTLEDIRATPIPRTNPVNLIFVLSQYAPKISEMHFDVPRDFFDLVMKSGLSSRSRATAFLWLMWWYLESNFTEEDALNNPYGPGRKGADGGLSIKTPQFEILTDEQAALENVDTEEEKQFGEGKRQERINILASDALAPVVTGPKRGVKRSGFTNNPVFSVISDDGAASPAPDQGLSPAPSVTGSVPASGRGRKQPLFFKGEDYASDTDRTRSVSPQPHQSSLHKATPGMRIGQILNDETPTHPPSSAQAPTSNQNGVTAPVKLGRGNWSKAKREAAAAANAAMHAKQRQSQGFDGSPSGVPGGGGNTAATPSGGEPRGPHGFYLPLNGSEPTHKRTRPLTAHQLAVERYRKQKVDFILDRELRKQHKASKRRREGEGAFARAWRQVRELPDGFDSEEELHVSLMQKGDDLPHRSAYRGFAGFRLMENKENESGEEAHAYKQAFSRVGRRLERWEQGLSPVRKKKAPAEAQEAGVAETVEDAGQGDPDEEDEDGAGAEGAMVPEFDDADEEMDDDDEDDEMEED